MWQNFHLLKKQHSSIRRLTKFTSFFSATQSAKKYDVIVVGGEANAGSCYCKFFSTSAIKLTHAVLNPVERIRNIGIIAHIDAGKTSATERFLYFSGFAKYIGNVDKGNTVTDFLEQERTRGITINSAVVTFNWKKHRINLIDTPGHVDFTVEVNRSLKILDGAVVILDGTRGVEAQTLNVCNQADHYKIPRICFINKLDLSHSSFVKSVESVRNQLKMQPLVIHIPLPENPHHIVDLIDWKLYDFNPSDGKLFSVNAVDTASSHFSYIKDAHTRMIEILADYDENIADYVLRDLRFEKIPKDLVKKVIQSATRDASIMPICCGSALKNIGIHLLLDSIVQYLPSPLDIPDVVTGKSQNISRIREEFIGSVFKIERSARRGLLSFLRVYDGNLYPGQTVFCISADKSKNKKEKVKNMFSVFADEFQVIKKATKGQIIAIDGLNESVTGDVVISNLNILDSIENSETLFETSSTEPVFFCSIETQSPMEERKLAAALHCLTREDPSFSVDLHNSQKVILSSVLPQTMTVWGMGELHLEIIKERLEKEFGINAFMGPLQVAYREIIQDIGENELFENMLFDGNKHMVSIGMKVFPVEMDNSKNICNKSRFEIAPLQKVSFESVNLQNLHPIVEKSIKNGVNLALNAGPLRGYNVINACVQLTGFNASRRTSQEFISACIQQCVHDTILKATPTLCEPQMKLDILCDPDKSHLVIADLTSRGCQIEYVSSIIDQNDSTVFQNWIIIKCFAPLSALIGYSSRVRQLTSGAVSFSMEHYGYQKLTEQNLTKLLADR